MSTTTTEKPTTEFVPAPPPPPETTTSPSTTSTTSIYARFEKSTKPPRGPMSLVIEGHSKVKMYKPGNVDPKEKHRPILVPIKPVGDPIQRRVVNTEEDGKLLEVKHLHTSLEKKSETKKIELDNKQKPEAKSPISSLLSFLDTSFGGLLVQEESSEELDSDKTDIASLKNVQGNDLNKEKENFRNVRNIESQEKKKLNTDNNSTKT